MEGPRRSSSVQSADEESMCSCQGQLSGRTDEHMIGCIESDNLRDVKVELFNKLICSNLAFSKSDVANTNAPPTSERLNNELDTGQHRNLQNQINHDQNGENNQNESIYNTQHPKQGSSNLSNGSLAANDMSAEDQLVNSNERPQDDQAGTAVPMSSQQQLCQASNNKCDNIIVNSNSSQSCQQKQSPHDDLTREPVAFSRSRNRWYTNEEVASILTSFSLHPEWQSHKLQVRPKSGAVLLYSREKVRYRQDGYCWKKRKNGRTTREDHMKLKVQGIECIYGCYVHSAILPTFHRRCYWLLENPDIVLVHYLNQPPDDQNKLVITFNSSLLEAYTRRSWTNEEIIEEIGSVFGGISQVQLMQHSDMLNQQQQPKGAAEPSQMCRLAAGGARRRRQQQQH